MTAISPSPEPRVVLVASDKWRGSFTAVDACAALAEGVRAARPQLQVQTRPVADGGEGTVQILHAALGGVLHHAEVPGPLGAPVVAPWWSSGDLAVVAACDALGHALVPAGARDVLAAGSAGLGALVRAALDAGARRLRIGLGGTLTLDGGLGLALALGAVATDAAGRPVAPTARGLLDGVRLDLRGLDPRLATAEIIGWCDVRSPLVGPLGAARVYGPQKGATPAQIDALDMALGRYAARWSDRAGRPVAELPGAGAAGGLGAAVVGVLGGTLVSGSAAIGALLDLDALVGRSDGVITGEGAFDASSTEGKAAWNVVTLARRRGVPVAVVCGRADGVRPDLPVFSGTDLGCSAVDASHLHFLAARAIDALFGP